MNKGEDDEAIHYFDFIFPRLKMAENHSTGKLPEIIECVQYPGETVFVPGGWWHAVLNLDNTIAITENVCNPGNFERVWIKTRKGRKRLAYKWLRKISKKYQELFEKAIQLNLRDNFIMWVPHMSKDKKARLSENPYSASESSEISSSSSSSSSSVSSDDEKTIDMIRLGCENYKKEASEFANPKKRPKFILLIRKINKKIKKRQKIVKQLEEEE